jgi:hypothetical protein
MLVVLAGSLAFAQRPDAKDQHRQRGRERARRPVLVVTPRADHTRVVVGRKEYSYAHGVFYRPGPKGYMAIRGPIGARIKVLPAGYLTFVVGGAPYYFYFGTYYNLDPVRHEYVVVAPPPGAPTVAGLDQVELVTGETVNGTYLGGTQTLIQMNVEGRIRQIPIEQVVSIVFAPPQE